MVHMQLSCGGNYTKEDTCSVYITIWCALLQPRDIAAVTTDESTCEFKAKYTIPKFYKFTGCTT